MPSGRFLQSESSRNTVALSLAQCGRVFAEIVFAFCFLNAASARAQTFLVADSPSVSAGAVSHSYSGVLANEVIARMLASNRARNEHLQNYSALRHYEVVNPDGQVSAQALIRVEYRSPGKKTFQKISEDGPWVIRRMVFDRLLQSEEATSSGQEWRESAITEENYTFAIVGEANVGPNRCYVVTANPKRADKYLFQGQLWIDAQDFGIVRISGRPATRMSLWITRAEFVREYQRIDGFWLPYRDETTVDMKLHGTKLFRIEHQQYVINAKSGSSPATVGFARSN